PTSDSPPGDLPLQRAGSSSDLQCCNVRICNLATLQRCNYPPPLTMFSTNQPVTSAAFYDREAEIGRLLEVFRGLAAGAPSWLAILGPRKIGKTSLILEVARRSADTGVTIVGIDATEDAPVSNEFFRRYALRVLDAV